jgi:phosphoglycolate phosphatase
VSEKPGHGTPAPRAHLIWDLDGTLVDSRRDLAGSVNWSLAERGFDRLSLDTVVSFVGDGTEALVARAVRAAGAPSSAVPAVLGAFEQYYAEHLLDATKFYPGIPEILDLAVSLNAELSVLTNKKAAYSEAILAGLGYAGSFRRILGGDSPWGLKPSPAGLGSILTESVVPPERSCMIGDSVVDMATAKAAGIQAVGALWGFGSESALREAGASRLLQAPNDLTQVLESLSSATARTSSISEAKVNSI